MRGRVRQEADARNALSKGRKDVEQKISKIEAELATMDKRKHEIVALLQDSATLSIL